MDEKEAVEIGKQVGARYLILGAFQRQGSTLRVTCRSVDVQTGRVDPKRAVAVTRELQRDAELFDLQDAVCEALLKSYSITPTDRERDLVVQAVTATTQRTAYDWYIQAREQYVLFTIEGYARAVPLFEKALEEDPRYALAWAGLAETLGMWGWQKEQNGEDAAADYRRCLEYARKAVGLAPRLAEAHRALAEAYAHRGEGAKRLEAARNAVALNPRDAEALYHLWWALGTPLEGRDGELIREALRIDPHLSAGWIDLGIALYEQGKLDEAVACYRKALEINPRDAYAHNNLGNALYDQGKLDEATACYRKVLEINPQHANAHYSPGAALKKQGKRDEAVAALQEYLRVAEGQRGEEQRVEKAKGILRELGAE